MFWGCYGDVLGMFWECSGEGSSEDVLRMF